VKRIRLTQASRSLAQYATELANEIIVVTKGDQPFAALVPLKNIDLESLALSSNPEFMRLIKRSRRQFSTGRTLTLEEMRGRVRRMAPPKKRPKKPAPHSE
jgi:antitoxin (DNA-binding transcriptional repressor) of toxin-antitoxin stability system